MNNVESVDLEEELYEHFNLKYLKTYFWIDKYLMGADSNATPWL
jgi:hypothetical protein